MRLPTAPANHIQSLLQQAISLHQAGQLSQAGTLYQQILTLEPQQPDALHLLGLIEHQQGHSDQALAHIRQAIQMRPGDAMFCFNLANMQFDLGQLDEAAALYQQTAQLAPASIDALLGLAVVYRAQGKLGDCAGVYRQVITLAPCYVAAYRNVGQILLLQGAPEKAEAYFRKGLALQPKDVDTCIGLADALCLQGKLGEAAKHFEMARAQQPKHSGAHLGLAKVRKSQDRLDEAAQAGRQALALDPTHDTAYINLANTYLLLGQLGEAVQTLQQALALNTHRGPEIYSNLLFIYQLQEQRSAAEVFAEHQRYAQRFEAPLKAQWQPHSNNHDPDRRLKVGYVSGDFCNHVVAYFIEPILALHDKAAFEIYAYYSYIQHDDHTQRIASSVDHWCECYNMTDEQLAQRIRADGIDILVDLSGHTVFNRLPMFARKPAPVQATWVGYPGSTGLSAIDYRITDPWQDPVGQTERYHSEQLMRLPSGMAFEPDPVSPDINELPALTSDVFMLACLNNLSKVNAAVVALWSRLLLDLPHARLMLGNVTDASTQQRLLGLFQQNSIGADRLLLQPRVPMADYLALHHQIDLALDPFPYNGGTTTLHSLWMGVPVVTLVGDHSVSRLSAAHLSRVGLNEFITHSEDDYLQCVLTFANDLPRLGQVRQSLRQRMNASECSPANITRHVEDAYRQMWRKWCSNL
ncbi:MAG: tetratricopeptide repeat protein [Rhodoferax sp.]|nr:tetratricopeptide repeat protein [Rhodoferax sp.]